MKLKEKILKEIADGRLAEYDGGYEGYKEAKAKQKKLAEEQEETARRAEYERQREASYRSKKDRAEEAKKKAEIRRIEGEIASLEGREGELNAQLADPQVTGDYKKLNTVISELEEVRAQLEELYSLYGQLL